MKFTIFFLLLILTLNLEPYHLNLQQNQNYLRLVEKKKHKDLHFTKKDKRFSEPFIGHLNVLDTSSFTIKIKKHEWNKENEKDELNTIVEKIQQYKFLGDENNQGMEYEIEGNEIFDEEKVKYEEIWKEILKKGEYDYENLFKVIENAKKHLSGKWEKITLIYQKSPIDNQHINSITVFQQTSDEKINLIYVILKNVSFKVNTKPNKPLIIFTHSNGMNPLSGYEIEPSDFSNTEPENIKNLLTEYLDLNAYKFLNDQYRSKTDFSFLNEEDY